MNKLILCVALIVISGCGSGYDPEGIIEKATQYCAERTDSITLSFDTRGAVTVSCLVPADKVLAK